MTTILDMDALRAAKDAYQDAAGNFPGTDRLVRSIITAYLSALAPPSTGAVGEPVATMHKGEADTLLSMGWVPHLLGYTSIPLYAAPPSSPSERDAALEEAAKVVRNMAADKRRKADAIIATDHDLDGEGNADEYNTHEFIASALDDAHKSIIALKASRSDTVGPEAGESAPASGRDTP
jgi:hypothetical protein